VGFFVTVAIITVPLALMLWSLRRRDDRSASFDGRVHDPYPAPYRASRFEERRKQWGPR